MKTLRFFGVVLSMLILLTSFTISSAEDTYPNKPITIINPWAVGGGIDLAARALSKELQTHFKQPVLVESRTGGMGMIAGDYIVRAKPDGYTIGTFSTEVSYPEVYSPIVGKASYSSQDLEPVVRWMVLPYGLASKSGMPWNDLGEFIKYVQSNPNKVRLGHAGVGNRYYYLYFALAKKYNLQTIEVPFKGAGELKTALVGGHVDVGLVSIAAVQGFIQAKKVYMLAIHSPKRMSELPEAPTFEELGYLPGFTYNMNGLYVPKGTPQEVKNKIHDGVKWALETPSFIAFAKANFFDTYYGSEKDLIEDMKKERETIPIIEEIAKGKK